MTTTPAKPPREPNPEAFLAEVRVETNLVRCTSCRQLSPNLRKGIQLALSQGRMLAAISELASKYSGVKATAIATHIRAGHEGDEYRVKPTARAT